MDARLWRVVQVRRTDRGRVADVVRQDAPDAATEMATRSLDDLVVVAEFRDPIYPGMRSTGRIERGGDKPFHAVINGENYHALQVLLYTHEGGVDAIYIDPPITQVPRIGSTTMTMSTVMTTIALQVAGVYGAPPEARQTASEPQ